MGWRPFIDTYLSGYISYVNRKYDPSQFAQIKLTDIPVEMSTYTDKNSKNNQEYAIMKGCFEVKDKDIIPGTPPPSSSSTLTSSSRVSPKAQKTSVDNFLQTKPELTNLEKFNNFIKRINDYSPQMEKAFTDIMTSTNMKIYTRLESQEKVKELFWNNPEFFSEYFQFVPRLVTAADGKKKSPKNSMRKFLELL